MMLCSAGAARALAAIALMLSAAALCAAPSRVLVVLSEDSSAYTEVATALRAALPRELSLKVSQITAVRATLEAELSAEPAVCIVTVGTKAATLVNATDTTVPVLHTLVPKLAWERSIQGKPGIPAARRRSAIFLDQPLERQLELIRLVLPSTGKVGVIYGPDSLASAAALEESARGLGMRIESESIALGSELPVALQRVLERSDVILGLPDPEVLNKSTIHNVLLSAYRAGDPVFAFSPAYVKAGALASVHSAPAQIGQQAGEVVARLVKEGNLPEAQYPRYFSVSVNRNVARSMGIAVEQDANLRDRLTQASRSGS